MLRLYIKRGDLLAKEKEGSKANWIIIIISILVLMVIGFFVTIIIAMFMDSSEIVLGNVALIPIKGVIVTSGTDSIFSSGIVSSEETVELIEKADENPSIKAILFEIDSPGGGAVASDEIGNAIKAVNKTTVAWIRDVGASGGYWVASACDKIVANRMSITGSIGVTSSYLEFSGLLDDYNVTYERLVSGEYKDMGSPFRSLTQNERAILQSKINTIHDMFVEEVSKNRNLDEETVRGLSTGMFYLGVEAKELGLIDELGGKKEAEELIKKEAGLDEIEIVEFKRKPTVLESLSQIISKSFFSIMSSNLNFLESNTQPKLELR